MRVSLATQPYDDGFHLHDFLTKVEADADLTELDIVVAWVKRTGMVQVRPQLDAIRGRGGTIRAIAGISLGGTSRQGLELLVEAVDETYVFHQPGRTFHPKLYAACGDERGVVLIGSHNLTLGGVSRNFEAGVVIELDLTVDEDNAFATELRDYVASLLADDAICRPLTENLKHEITNLLSDEDKPGGVREPIEGPELPLAGEQQAEGVFGVSKHLMRAVGSPSTRSSTRPPRQSQTPHSPTGASPTQTPAVPSSDPVVRRWYKTLPAADAQQLTGSNPSGTMTLVQSGHSIDADAYFRDEFFGDESWTPSQTRGRGQARETTIIRCEVVVHSQNLGSYSFNVRHTPGYDAEQANRTTELGWGDFGQYLRANRLTDSVATLEKTASGRYRLTIDDQETGPFRF